MTYGPVGGAPMSIPALNFFQNGLFLSEITLYQVNMNQT